jgi:Zn-dependent protease
MLRLLILPIELLRVAFYALKGLVDALMARDRLRSEFTVLINAPREAVWRFGTADRMVLDGPPRLEISSERLPDSADLWLTRVAVNGQPFSQGVYRRIERDEASGVARVQFVEHALSVPPAGGRDIESGLMIAATPAGTTLTMFNEVTVRSFRDRIVYPISPRSMSNHVKRQIEKEADTYSRLAALGNHWLLLSAMAIMSFWYLFGWKLGLLLSVVIVVHEAGHVAAMLMAGVGVRGIYLIPFFGGAAVPKTAYRTEGRLGFIALMGPGLSLIPTFGLLALFQSTGNIDLRQAVEMFAIINAANMLPIYPLDGGLILNALIGSVNRKSALIVGWIGVMIGLGLAVYLRSFLIGVPFLLFALQRYLTGGQTAALERLSIAGGIALALASTATLVLYVWLIASVNARPAETRRMKADHAAPIRAAGSSSGAIMKDAKRRSAAADWPPAPYHAGTRAVR